MQLTRLALLLLLPATLAHADGELTVRGGYYKERSTRVMQPMMDMRADTSDEGELRGHLLLDAITSASVAAGAQAGGFTERRYEIGAGYRHRVGPLTPGGSIRYSYEPDYKSLFVTGELGISLFSQNTELVLAGSYGSDDISNASAQGGLSEGITGQLTTVLTSVSLTQVLSPTLVGQLTYDFTIADGFQENPYRTVAAGGMLLPERVPEKRYRHATALAARQYFPDFGGLIAASYRLYADNWGILGHTPEVRWIQELASELFVHARYRFHTQNRADFFRRVYNTGDPLLEPFITDDPKLGALATHTIGSKLELGLGLLGLGGRAGGIRAELAIDYLIQDTRYGNALQALLGVTVPFGY